MRSIALVVAAFLGLLAAGSPLSAESASSPEGDTERRASSFIPVDEITVRAEALHDRIVELEQLVSDDGLERSAEEKIAGVELEIEAVQTRLDETASRRHGPTELETLSASWRGLDARLLSAKDGIDARASQLAARLAEIRDADVRWRRARADARAAQAPGRVVDLAAGVLSGLRALEEKLEESRNAALDIQARIAEERRLVGVGLKEVEGMRVELAASLLVRQDDPVWRARPSREGVEAELEETRLDLARIGAQLGEHVSRHRERFLLQALLVFVLAWGLSRARSVLRRHAESSKEAGESILPLNALARPWAAALLLGTLAMPFLHPERVLGHQIAVLLLTIPVWLLVLRTLLPTASRASLMGLAALPLVDVVRLLAGGFELLVQVLLVAEFALGLGGALWLRNPERLSRAATLVGHGFWLRALAVWVRLVFVAFGVGLLAALFGYSNLAARIALVSIWGSYIGVAFVAGVRILEAAAQGLVLESRLEGLPVEGAYRERVLVAMRRGTRALAFVAWVYLFLQAAQLWGPVRGAAETVLTARAAYGSFALSLGGLVAFGFTLWLSWLLARFVSFALDQLVFPRVQMAPGVPLALSTFSRYAILVVGFLAALTMLGFSFDRLALLLSALGVGIGFGLQNAVNNFVSGAILLFERPIRVGDLVQLDDLLGEILHIGIRASRIRTFDGADVIVPNGDLISARVVNWTLSDRKRRVTVPVGVAYGTRPREVIEILVRVAQNHPEVLGDPAPDGLFKGFGDSSLDFELRAFTDSQRGWLAVESDLAVGISEALEQAGVTIPFPRRDLHLQNVRELGAALAEAVADRQPPRDKSG